MLVPFRSRMARTWRRRVPLLLMLCAGPSMALAADATPTLRDAIRAALAHNPDLATFEYEFRANEADRRTAALKPPLEAGIGLENFLGSGATAGFDAAELTLSLSQVIELGGKREARIASIDASREALRATRQAAQLDTLAEVARRFLAVAEAQEKLRLAQRGLDLATATVRAAEERVQAAKAPHVELDRATVARQRAQLELQGTRSGLDAARRLLAAMWGASDASLDGAALGEVQARLFDLPEAGEYATLLARLEQSPDLLRFASEERLRESELRLAVAQQRADLTVGGGLRRLQAGGDFALVASVSLPLFAGKRAGSAITAATARRDAVGAQRNAALVRARSDLYALHQQLRDAIAVVQALEATTLPKMEEALQETQYAFERGRYGYLELVDAQREYLAVQRERIDAAALAQTLAIEIERLTNAPLAEESP